MAVSDYRAGKIVATAPIGAGVDGAGFDAGSGNAFASGADGTLTVIHEDAPNRYRVVQTLETMKGSRNMGLDTLTHTIFLSGATFEPQAPGARGRPRIAGDSYVLLEVERR
jgi:hypothetical protein